MSKYILFTIMGFALLAFGAVLAKLSRETQGLMQTLPYLCIGIGAGIFGHYMGAVITLYSKKKDPLLAKKIEIEEKDERNITINNKAKAKAYDITIFVFGVLIFAFAFIQIDLGILLSIIASYLFVNISYFFYITKYSKEM